MNEFLKIYLWFLILHFVVVSCSNKNEKTTITIKSASQLNAKVKITISKNLDYTTLVESKTDSAGHSSFEISLRKPIFVTIQIGEEYGELYLSPGDDLLIRENGQDNTIPLTFSGNGAEINNYVFWVNSNVEKIKWANGRGVAELETDEFLHRFDSLKNTINGFHDSYLDSVILPEKVVSMLEYKNRIKFLAVGEEYKFYRLNNALNEKWEAYHNGQDYLDDKVSKEFENLTDEIPFDPTLLTDGYEDYQVLLNLYWRNKIDLPIAEKLISSKDSGNLAPLMSNALINKGDYPQEIREFLLAFNIDRWLAALGITPRTDSIFSSFKNKYKNSNYLSVLNKRYDEWLAISPGKPAPEFVGYNQNGEKVSLHDLKGKIIYIDVWATWCGPCVAAIPASKELQQAFLNEENVQFLNISIDGNKSDWKQFLKENQTWKGLHIIIEPDKGELFRTSYKLFGVPNYILIDQSGDIVNVKASPPSANKIRREIKQLLAKEV